jgi:hypothetical protein
MKIWLPYVYIATHKTSKKFYIGMRSANQVIAELDLGIHYFTSSKTVQTHFQDYDFKIIAYFVDHKSAFIFENQIIECEWGNPLLINKHFQKTYSNFSMAGFKRPDVIDYNKETKSKPKEFREYECTCCRDTFYREEHCHHHRSLEPFCSKACVAIHFHKGKHYPNKTKPRPYQLGRTPWNKGLTKFNDPRIASYGQSVSRSTKGRTAWNKGLSISHNDALCQSNHATLRSTP